MNTMKAIIILHVLLFALLVPAFAQYTCPSSTNISPCTCDHGDFRCVGIDDRDFERVFQAINKNLGPKALSQLVLKDTKMTKLDMSLFKDITFQAILIINTDLESIIPSPLAKTNAITYHTYIAHNKHLSEDSILSFVKSFPNLNQFNEENNTLFTHIPDECFSSDVPLNQISIMFLKSPRSIGRYAFRQLSRLSQLYLGDNFSHISGNGFYFDEQKNSLLTIDIPDNGIDGNGFGDGSFFGAKRPIAIDLNAKLQLSYLNEKAFKPFFDDNNRNVIYLNTGLRGPIDCQDCRNYWVKKGGYASRIKTDVPCKNFKQFDDPDNFVNC